VYEVGLRYWHDYSAQTFRLVAQRYAIVLLATTVAVLALVASLPSALPVGYTIGLTLLSIGYAALIMVAVGRGMGDNAATRLTAFVGRHSYSIYLWHLAVLAWVMPLLAGPLRLRTFGRFMFVYTILALAIGVAMSRLIEWPVLRLRDRWIPVTPPRTPPASASASVIATSDASLAAAHDLSAEAGR